MKLTLTLIFAASVILLGKSQTDDDIPPPPPPQEETVQESKLGESLQKIDAYSKKKLSAEDAAFLEKLETKATSYIKALFEGVHTVEWIPHHRKGYSEPTFNLYGMDQDEFVEQDGLKKLTKALEKATGKHTKVETRFEDIDSHFVSRHLLERHLADEQQKLSFNTVFHNYIEVSIWKPKYKSDIDSVQYTATINAKRAETFPEVRLCPYGLAFTAVSHPETDQFHVPGGKISSQSTDGILYGQHAYEECSGKGTCDTTTGECICYRGYEGKACRRANCPNDCSGNGRCVTNVDYNNNYGRSKLDRQQSSSAWQSLNVMGKEFWDYNKRMVCKCDLGYSGADCSLRNCPRGDDKFTTCVNEGERTEDWQVLDLKDIKTGSFYTITYTDNYGGTTTSYPIRKGDKWGTNGSPTNLHENKNKITFAIAALQNSVTPRVQVDVYDDFVAYPMEGKVSANGDYDDMYIIKFISKVNAGANRLLRVTSLSAVMMCDGGMQPMYKNGISQSYVNLLAVRHPKPLSDAIENAVCGNRGVCNTATGTCKCHSGHSGEACTEQTTFL